MGDCGRWDGKNTLLITFVLVLSACGASPGTAKLPASNAAASSAQSLSAASMGYVWDGAGLRPVLGVPGASYFGAAAYSGVFRDATVAGVAQHALLSRSDGELFLASLPGGIPHDLGAKLGSLQRIALSPSGTAGVVYGDQPGVLILTGLPNAPRVQSLKTGIVVSSAAISDNGLGLLAMPQPGGVLIASASNAEVKTITTLSAFGGMVFLKSSDDAIIADASRNQLFLAKNLVAVANLEAVATSEDGISQPVGVSTSRDGRWAVVANGKGNGVVRVDLKRLVPAIQLGCQCIPREVAALRGNAVFRLNGGDAGPMWVFDGDSAEPRIVFVPAVHP